MKQPDNPPEWATHWSPPINPHGNNPLGFWVGEIDRPFPLFQGVAWNERIGTRRLGGRDCEIFRKAIPILESNLENE